MSAFAANEDVCLKFSGGREVVNEETVQRLINEWKETNTIDLVKNVNLSNKCYTSEASLPLADLLSSLPNSLLDVNLSDIIASRPEDDALITLRNIGDALRGKELVSVNLSDNALGAKGIEASRPILEGKCLQQLFLCNVGLSKEACELVSEILLAGGLPSFNTLHFYNNMSGSGGAIAISRVLRECRVLKDFRFSATRSSSDGCLVLAESLAEIHNLEKLDLSDNTFGAQAAKRLGEALRNHTTLKYVSLRDDGLSDKGLRAFITALDEVDFPVLEWLDLSGNDMAESSATKVGQWLVRRTPAVQSLHFDDNDLGSAGAVKLSKQLEHLRCLKTLSLNTCEIGGRGALAIARVVATIESFQKLELNGNSIPVGVVDEIREILGTNGKSLGDMDENDEDAEDEDDEEEGEEDD